MLISSGDGKSVSTLICINTFPCGTDKTLEKKKTLVENIGRVYIMLRNYSSDIYDTKKMIYVITNEIKKTQFNLAKHS